MDTYDRLIRGALLINFYASQLLSSSLESLGVQDDSRCRNGEAVIVGSAAAPVVCALTVPAVEVRF